MTAIRPGRHTKLAGVCAPQASRKARIEQKRLFPGAARASRSSGGPAALEAYLTLGAINGKAGLTLVEREVVQITAAASHGCGFCVAGHTKLALKKAGMSDDTVEALRNLSPVGEPKLAALQAFTRAVIATRGAVADSELAAFKAAGYSDGAALEVVLGVGLATICNFANNLGQPELNPELDEFRWQRPQPLAAE